MGKQKGPRKPKFELGQRLFNIHDYQIYETEPIAKIVGTDDGWQYSGGAYLQNQVTDDSGFLTREEAEAALKTMIDTAVKEYRKDLEAKGAEEDD